MSSHTWQASRDRQSTVSARRLGGAVLCAASTALLAALPAAPAVAQPAARGGTAAAVGSLTKVRRLSSPGELLPAGQLEGLLAGLPLSDLSTAQLAHYLAGLEDIGLLAHLNVGLHGTEELGLAGLEDGLSEGIKQLGGSATIGELENKAALLPALEGKLNGLLSSLLGSALDSGQKQQLSEGLEKIDLTQLVGSLLGSAKEPTQLSGLVALADSLVEALGPSTVQGLLGSTLEGSFAPTTAENTAQELGTTTEALSEELGQTGNALQATTTMLTAPVTGGKLLAIAPAVKGLALGLLEGPSAVEEGGGGGEAGGGSKETSGGSKESGSGSGTGKGGGGAGQGGSGGTGTAGSGGSGGGTGPLTLVVNMPSPAAATPTPAATTTATKPGKVQIRSWRTKGDIATLVLQAPAAGRLTVRGHDLKSKTVHVAKAKRVTLTVKLSRAATASLRRHRRPLKTKLVASFTSTAQASSSTTVTLTFG